MQSHDSQASGGDSAVSNAITSFTNVMETLQTSHRRLEEKARHVEAELCEANDELGRKVRELDRVKQHLEGVLTSIPTGVVVYDSEGRIVRANDAAVSILATERTELLGAAAARGLAGPSADGEPAELRCADGVARVLARRYSPVTIEGQPAGGVEVIEDQSAIVRAKERLHRLDKTAALGTMAGGVAHEIRNPLNAIQGFAELFLRECDGDARAMRHAVRIREGVSEIEAIVTSMLGLTGDGDLCTESFNVRAVVREATEAVMQERRDPSRWPIELVGPAARFSADRIKVRQALRNLISNACDAQPDGGPVRVVTSEFNGGVKIVVSDDGPGVAPEDVERVCDPFYTTRADGTGMGLALVQRVVELHGGRLDIGAAEPPLTGAAFTVLLPDSAASAHPGAAA